MIAVQLGPDTVVKCSRSYRSHKHSIVEELPDCSYTKSEPVVLFDLTIIH